MHTSITNEQLVKFVINDVNEEERQKIIEAITINSVIKDRYLYEKRKYDVERYINDEMDIGECCEIEELIKMDSRLFDHFESNNGIVKDEQDVTIKIPITKEQFVKFILNDVYEKEYKKIIEAINTNSLTKERYLFEKRKYDVERYLDSKMDIGERCEIQELLKTNSRLFEYFDLKRVVNEEKQNASINLMHTSITKEQLVNFVLNDVNEEEREKIIEAIDTNSEIKEIYLFEKRKHDVERYINDEPDIGECCEIEELIKMDSRLYDYFESNTEANEEEAIEEEQDVSINVEHLRIIKEQLVNFILNDDNEEYIGEYKKISKVINTNSVIKEIYLFEKRKYDIERYLNNEMDFGERCEIEELLKINSSLYDYFDLKKDLNDEGQNVTINGQHISISKEQLVNFVLNDINDEEREKIIEAINTKSVTKERYLFEKRKYDVERYIDDEMNIGERCEIEEIIKMDSRLYDYFELNDGVMEEEQDESINPKQIDITNDQLFNFVLNDVTEEERKKISEAINTNPLIKERYLFEKRKYDIDRYHDDEVNFGERCEIEELLEKYSSLHAHFDLIKDLNKFLQTTLNECGKIEDEVRSKKTALVIKLNPGILRMSKWLAAASIIITIGLSSGNIYLNNRASLENRLYAKYHEPLFDKNNNFFISSLLTEAKDRYRNKEFDVALMLIENLPNSMTIESEKLLYRGLIFMELERFDEAINDLEQINNNNYLAIKSIVNWHLALCYLKTGKQEKAKGLFEMIVQRNDSRSKEAKKILVKISNP